MSYTPPAIPRPASPTPSDDRTKGLRVGCQWVDTLTGSVWFCVTDTPGNAVWARMGTTTIDFGGAGVYVPSVFVGQVWFNRTGMSRSITDVTLWHQTCGLSGNTVIDILVDAGSGWVSVWNVNPANRPSLNAALGNDASVSGGPMDNPVVPNLAKVRMDIVSVQTGAPANLLVQVTL